ncbi:uncharacterized protein TNCV_4417051 [Trichonephila clavipes]|uniref:Uncharacterized protein n=1 Tax=Trichonephila clavipes TaxID=2585209 RepID=A0A8X6RZF4_TRICX|nr:uncharacterized protein TNCV_4417051 [Trichonephila clavipes]
MMKTAFGDELCSGFRKWLQGFKEGHQSVNNDPVLDVHPPLAMRTRLHNNSNNDPEFKKLIIPGDESWVYGYDPETKQQSSQWKTPGSPWPKKAWQVCFSMQMELFIMSYPLTPSGPAKGEGNLFPGPHVPRVYARMGLGEFLCEA